MGKRAYNCKNCPLIPSGYTPHRQIKARISLNVFENVDEQLKDMIELLNTFPNIKTTESCQGDNSHYASIFIECRGDAQNTDYLYKFCCKLSTILAKRHYQKDEILTPEYEISIHLVWDADKSIVNPPYILLKFPNRRIYEITNIISYIRPQFAHNKGYIQ
ncbi:MAG: hypothetical protein JW901_08840 [Dehalococcoidia bacterium]|nr:hypothetical protein [Dehalococcoidia bacterium]